MPGRLIVFGAFDRHNLGDLLFAHVLEALLPGRELVFAGLAARDLRPFGGHRVRALAEVARECDTTGDAPAAVLHAGGELLGCSAWQAAVMLQAADEADALVAYFERHPGERDAWVRSQLGTAALAPYAAARRFFRSPVRTAYVAVGGVDWPRLPGPMRAELVEDLRAARVVTVREERTLAHLEAQGVRAGLLPDPAVMFASLFGERIRTAAGALAVAAGSYLATQCSAEFDDDATLDALGRRVDAERRRLGCDVVLFRAGAAPLHDRLATLERLAERLPAGVAKIADTLDVWALCALIAGSRTTIGSSLHVQIVAEAFGVPVQPLRSPAASTEPTKHEAWRRTWGGRRDLPQRFREGLASLLERTCPAAAADAGSTG